MTITAKKLTAFICAAALAVCSCACGRQVLTGDGTTASASSTDSASASSASDGKFSLYYDKNETMNPMRTLDLNNQLVCCVVFENMVEVDGTFTASPKVVSKWSSDDGKTWTLTVDSTRKFSDGSSVSGKDVAYSLRAAINSARYENRFSGWISSISSDGDTVTVTLNKANTQFPLLLTVPVIKYNSAGEHPIGTGPYAYAADHLSLTPNSSFSGGTALPVDTIYLQTYDSAEDFVSKFEDSTVDVVINDPSTASNVGFASANEVRVFTTTNLHYICFNLESPVFAGGDLQFALNYAFDRDYMAKNLMGGNAAAATIPINPSSTLYDTSYDGRFSYNLEKCKTTLENSGFKDMDGDGFLEYMSDGAQHDVNINFLVCSDSGAKVSLAEKFAEDMKTLGISVTVKKLDFDDYKQALTAGSFDMCYCEIRLAPDFDPSPMLLAGGAAFYSRVTDTNMQGYIDTYLAAGDDNREKACKDMCEYIVNTATIIPICFEKHQIITHRGAITNMSVNQNDPICDFAKWTVSIK